MKTCFIKSFFTTVAWPWLVIGLMFLVGFSWFAFQLPKAWSLDHKEGTAGTLTLETIKCLDATERAERRNRGQADCTLTGTFVSDDKALNQSVAIDADYGEFAVGDKLRKQYLDGTYESIDGPHTGVLTAGATSIGFFAAAMLMIRSFWRSLQRWRSAKSEAL